MSVGAYIHEGHVAGGTTAPTATFVDNLHPFSSRGPAEDGALQAARSSRRAHAISSMPLWQSGAAGRRARTPLPPGYAMINGTSMASPQAHGRRRAADQRRRARTSTMRPMFRQAPAPLMALNSTAQLHPPATRQPSRATG